MEDVMEENRLEHLHTVVKVVLTADVQKLSVGGRVYEEMSKGSVLNIWRWAADALVQMGVAEYSAKNLSTNQLIQVEWREKNNPGELQPLPRHFYIEWMREVRRGDAEVSKRLADILTMRMMKIVTIAARRLDGDVVRRLTPEEEALYREIYSIVDKWFKSFKEIGS